MERDHWDELFDELYLRTYVRLHEADSETEALSAARLAGLEPPDEILDAPCGFGRHANPLARAGYRVTGVDRSEPQLAEARRLAADPANPRFLQADHRDLPLPDSSFDAVLCLFSSLGYRGEDGDRRTLAEFRRVLRPGGALVIETMHRDRLMAIFQPEGWEELPDAGLLVERRRFDHVAGETEALHMLVDGDGTRRSVTYRVRTYTATELVRLVEEAGFAGVECFGGLAREELVREARLVVLARAPQ